MKKKIIIGVFIGFLIFLAMFIVLNVSTESEQIVENGTENKLEIEPEEEISEEVNYDTTIRLYFFDETSGIMSGEDRKIDARKLIDNPYIYAINLLINGPEKQGLRNAIPEGTKVNSANLRNGTLSVDLSEEFLNANGTDAIYSIVNTLYEFNEIDNIKFTINGEEKDGLKEKFVKKE